MIIIHIMAGPSANIKAYSVAGLAANSGFLRSGLLRALENIYYHQIRMAEIWQKRTDNKRDGESRIAAARRFSVDELLPFDSDGPVAHAGFGPVISALDGTSVGQKETENRG
jgi:hypothetical protein